MKFEEAVKYLEENGKTPEELIMEILPCPFCGSNDLYTTQHRTFEEIYCDCGASNSSESWNTRNYDNLFIGKLTLKENIYSWISVKDKLPEENGRYLVVEDHISRWRGVDHFRNGKFTMKVTHWMPLPTLPEEK